MPWHVRLIGALGTGLQGIEGGTKQVSPGGMVNDHKNLLVALLRIPDRGTGLLGGLSEK